MAEAVRGQKQAVVNSIEAKKRIHHRRLEVKTTLDTIVHIISTPDILYRGGWKTQRRRENRGKHRENRSWFQIA